MHGNLKIGEKTIGPGYPTYIIAEMSANHNQSFERAVQIIKAAKKSGADAIKLQTYTADTITIDVKSRYFNIQGTIWDGQNLYDLYKQAYTPWGWQPELKKIADEVGLDLFSTPFDSTAVDFLEEMNVPAYKIASFEVVDIPLLSKVSETGKPIIMSTGMASLGEIEEAVNTIKKSGNHQVALLKCTSAYPAPHEESNLKTIMHLSETFGLPSGLSDHTMGGAVAVAAVALGASIIEKHFTINRENPGPDSSFSMEPDEFSNMVQDIRIVEKSVGKISYEITDKQKASIRFRRSLFAVDDIKAGENFTPMNIKSIRPAHGLHTRHYKDIIGKIASIDIVKGTPLSWELIK